MPESAANGITIVSNPKFRDVRWAVKYDPDNLDHVLAVNEDGSLRFMLERKHVQPMALADRREGCGGSPEYGSSTSSSRTT